MPESPRRRSALEEAAEALARADAALFAAPFAESSEQRRPDESLIAAIGGIASPGRAIAPPAAPRAAAAPSAVWDALRGLAAAARLQQRELAELRRERSAVQPLAAALDAARGELAQLRCRVDELGAAQRAAAEAAAAGSEAAGAAAQRGIQQLERELRSARDDAEQRAQQAAGDAAEALRRCAAVEQEAGRSRAEARRCHAALQQLERRALDDDAARQGTLAALTAQSEEAIAACDERIKKLAAAGAADAERAAEQLREHGRRLDLAEADRQELSERVSAVLVELRQRSDQAAEVHRSLAAAAAEASDAAQNASAEAAAAASAAAAARAAGQHALEAEARRWDEGLAEAAAGCAAAERRGAAAVAQAAGQVRGEWRQGLREHAAAAGREREALREELTHETKAAEQRLREALRTSHADAVAQGAAAAEAARQQGAARLSAVSEEHAAAVAELRAALAERASDAQEQAVRLSENIAAAQQRAAQHDDELRAVREAAAAHTAVVGEQRRRIREVEMGLESLKELSEGRLARDLAAMTGKVDAVADSVAESASNMTERAVRELRHELGEVEGTLRREATQRAQEAQKLFGELTADCDALYAVWGLDKRRARRAKGADERLRLLMATPGATAMRRSATTAAAVVPHQPTVAGIGRWAERPPAAEHPPSPRGSVGLQVSDAVPGRRGAVVSAVVRGSLADAAGVREGDIVLYLGGHRTDSRRDLAEALRNTQQSGVAVKLTRIPAGRVEPVTTELLRAGSPLRRQSPTRGHAPGWWPGTENGM